MNMNNSHLYTDLPSSVAVLGAGTSGIAATQYLVERGIRVFISDVCDRESLDFRLAANDLAAVPHEAGGHSDAILRYEAIVVSPGIPTGIPVIEQAVKNGIPVWSEIELAFRICKAPVLAVTGSTGKSTTVCFLGSILEHAGKRAPVVGNIGVPAISSVASLGRDDWAVIEVSSFQLENIDRFKPRGACVLNLLANHLDRYKNMKEYGHAKKQIAKNLNGDNFLVLNASDPLLEQWAGELQHATAIVRFGSGEVPGECAWYEGGMIHYRLDRDMEGSIDISGMALVGAHNRRNACAAAAMALRIGVPPAAVEKGICNFRGLPHRLEFVTEIGGVKFYNDSKATTAESVKSAIEAFANPVHLIAGGKDKGCDFKSVRRAVEDRVNTVYCIGEAAARIKQTWHGAAKIRMCESLSEAVMKAHGAAHDNDIVLLSPGCSSFDMFDNFEHRGEIYKKSVLSLESGKKNCD
ncbi:MAG: UDP-N-acetylmuramoyl-L-alanine--D-glutamate ligase [Chitinivibrionales bacterium]|nr:UDP-N-acetylmuramoyl-L-alanine--D-glutamate ligase [Chitinivibrionales bacterium]